MHSVDRAYIFVFPLRFLWERGADFCSPEVILGNKFQTVVTSLSIQWKHAQILLVITRIQKGDDAVPIP